MITVQKGRLVKRGNRVLQDERETWAYRVPKESKVRHFVMLQTTMVVGRALPMKFCLSIVNPFKGCFR